MADILKGINAIEERKLFIENEYNPLNAQVCLSELMTGYMFIATYLRYIRGAFWDRR
ncbi:MAG: hypothetical protein H6850_01025 [Alphaproteobacteria bacterium]|nr:MAG: hypothetical protein H6850_01025 [Alphaproteobacteria bacterium]